MTAYPGTIQLVAHGLGRDAPTVIITNADQIKTRALVWQYARALSSTVNLNVDFDVALCALAPALAAFRNRLGPGYAAATPDTLQRRFPETSGTVTSDDD